MASSVMKVRHMNKVALIWSVYTRRGNIRGTTYARSTRIKQNNQRRGGEIFMQLNQEARK